MVVSQCREGLRQGSVGRKRDTVLDANSVVPKTFDRVGD
jgi:hypothetical protein